MFVISAYRGYKPCVTSFLFSLVNPSGMGPTKLPLKIDKYDKRIYCNRAYGPTFGEGHDLHISSNANSNSDSYSKLNDTYECPPNVNPSTLLAGSANFVVNELEVFVHLGLWA